MTNPSIFIVLPVYNGEQYILQQLMSIYYQTFKNRHLIIINDGSTDNTLNIVNRFQKDYELTNKITVKTQKNKGLNQSIENGLIIAKQLINENKLSNVYISYCDADDIRMRNKLEFELNYIIKDKGDLCYHDLVLIDENENLISNSYNKILHTPTNNIFDNSFLNFCLYNHITATTILFKSEYIEKILPISNGLYQDWYTSLIISGLNGKILSINKPLAYYRRHSNSMLGSNKKSISDYFNGFITVLSNIKGRLPKDNKDICDYMITYYHERLKNNKNKIYNKLFIIIKYPTILKKLLKNQIIYFLNKKTKVNK